MYDKGIVSAALSIIKDDGPTVLLGGLGSTVVGYGIEGAMKFGVYEVCKPIMTKLIKGSKGAAYIAASVFAGAVASILLCPMESTRIRQVTDPEYADKGLMAAFPQLVKEEGFGPMFSGIWAMLSKQVSISIPWRLWACSFPCSFYPEPWNHHANTNVYTLFHMSAAHRTPGTKRI